MLIKVRVSAGAKREKIEKMSDDSFVIALKEPAEQNLANGRVKTILSKAFKTKNIRLVAGVHSSHKIFSVG